MLPHFIKYYKIIVRPLIFVVPFYRAHTCGWKRKTKKKRNREKIYGLPLPAVWHRKQICCVRSQEIPNSRSFYLNFKCAQSDIKMKYSQISVLSFAFGSLSAPVHPLAENVNDFISLC